jgi:hypothetical protein
VWGQEEGFGNLLSDGASALNDASCFNVFKKCPDNAEKVNAFMFVKSSVFGRNKGIYKHLWHLGKGQHNSSLPEELCDLAIVIRVNCGDNRRAIIPQGRYLGKISCKVEIGPADEKPGKKRKDNNGNVEKAKPPA